MPGTRPAHDVLRRLDTIGVHSRWLTPVLCHGRARRRSFASRRRPGRGSSSPGLSRPSTFLAPRASTWMPGTRPGMTVLRAGRYSLCVASHPLRRGWTPVTQSRRHGRARRRSFASRRRPGHPRSLLPRARTWMPGTRPGMTVLRAVRYLRSVASASFERMERRSANVVMAGPGDEASLRADVPAIHVLWRREQGRGCPAQGRA